MILIKDNHIAAAGGIEAALRATKQANPTLPVEIEVDTMDQLREGINLRAYGQKNPLLEYKSEGFKMFQEMMADMSATTIQRLFRTKLQGMEESTTSTKPVLRNIETSHQETTGMGLKGRNMNQVTNKPNQVRTPVKVDQKMGRNQRILVQGPDGKQVEIKYKKLQSYLDKGFTQV